MRFSPRLLAVPALALLSACATQVTPVPYARPYPTELIQRETLNIQVFRSTYNLEFTNTTARPFGPSTVWLNARYCKPIDGLAVGQTLTLLLTDFRDEYSESFRAGGFFASEAPEKLVLAQIQTKGGDDRPVMLGMIVVKGEDE